MNHSGCEMVTVVLTQKLLSNELSIVIRGSFKATPSCVLSQDSWLEIFMEVCLPVCSELLLSNRCL